MTQAERSSLWQLCKSCLVCSVWSRQVQAHGYGYFCCSLKAWETEANTQKAPPPPCCGEKTALQTKQVSLEKPRCFFFLFAFTRRWNVTEMWFLPENETRASAKTLTLPTSRGWQHLLELIILIIIIIAILLPYLWLHKSFLTLTNCFFFLFFFQQQ